jgi:tetratricopeptide (TPR) repeat protein
MTGRFYMGNDFRNDHSFRIPRPDQSLKYNTPNACIQCHDDKDNEWAWETFKEQYGVPDYKHFSDLLIPGLRGELHGMESLLTLVNDTIYPDIARASAVRGMSNYLNSNNVTALINFLNDPSPLVRATSIDVLSELNTTDYVMYFIPLLKDKKRAVRVKAFFAISGLGEDQIPIDFKEVYKKVEVEFFTSLGITADFVGGRIRRANYNLKKGDVLKGIEGYEKAIEIDNLNNIARTNLANLYYNNGEIDKAEAAFKTIIEQEPEFGPTYYSLGLLLAELERNEEAIEQLEIAATYMPQNVRIFYNLSLLYDKINRPKKAEKAILNGLKIAPENDNLLYALAYHYSKNGDIERARNVAAKLVELYPGNAQYLTFLRQLNALK